MNCKHCGRGPLFELIGLVAGDAKWGLDRHNPEIVDPWGDVVCDGRLNRGIVGTHEPEDVSPQEINEAIDSIMRRET